MAEKPASTDDDKEKKGKAEEGAGDKGEAKADKDDASAGSEKADKSSKEGEDAKNLIPRDRFNEESKKRKEAETKLAEIEKKQREDAEAAEVEKGNWKTVAETKQKRIEELEAEVARLKPLADKVETLEGSIKQSLEARVKALPEKVQKMAPTALDALQAWLPDAEALAADLNGKSESDDKSKANGKGKAETKDDKTKRGAGKSPAAAADDKSGDAIARAKASQAGFTLRQF